MILKLWIPKTFIGWWYLLFRWKNFVLHKEEIERALKLVNNAYTAISARNAELYEEKRHLNKRIENLELILLNNKV